MSRKNGKGIGEIAPRVGNAGGWRIWFLAGRSERCRCGGEGVAILTWWTKRTNLGEMKTVNVHEAKTAFSQLLAKVEKSNQRVVICRNGEPVADLVPHKHKSRTRPHPALRKIQIKYNPVEPLSPDEWPVASR
jgi:prevent-host-death family protein